MKGDALLALLRTPQTGRVARLLGEGSALWTPRLKVGLASPATPGRPTVAAPPLLVISQSRVLASRLLCGATARGLDLLGVIATPRGQTDQWQELAVAATELSPAPSVLVALDRPTTLARLIALAHRAPDLLLLALGRAGTVEIDPRLPPLPLALLGSALGWCTTSSMAEALEAARLPRLGAARRIVALADSDEEAALLEHALASHDLGTKPSLRRVPDRVPPGSDLLLVGPTCAAPEDLAVPLVRLTPPDPPLSVQLGAIAARLRAAGAPPRALPRPASSSAEAHAAGELLDTLRDRLGELDVRRLLDCFGLPLSDAALVRSASAAGQAARGRTPARLRALGPERQGRPQPRIENLPTAARCKQAFRDLLTRCRTQTLDGILVERQGPVARPEGLDAVLIWCEGLTLLWLRLGDRALVSACPRTRRAAQALVGRLLPADRPGRGTTAKTLAPLLVDLARFADQLADRMIWLHLPLITLPRADAPPQIVGGLAQQRFSLQWGQDLPS